MFKNSFIFTYQKYVSASCLSIFESIWTIKIISRVFWGFLDISLSKIFFVKIKRIYSQSRILALFYEREEL